MVDKLLFCGELFTLRCFFKNLPMLCPILIGSLFYEGFYAKNGLDFPLAHDHRSVRPTRLGPSGPIFCFYPLQVDLCIIQNLFLSVFFFPFIKNDKKNKLEKKKIFFCSHATKPIKD